MHEPKLIDVIVLFQDIRYLSELARCLFSLIGQSYRPIHICIAMQRFSRYEIGVTRKMLAPLFDDENAPAMTVVNWEDPYPADAGAMLLNLGLATARGRYIAIINCHDVLYPEAYKLLIDRLQECDAAIAFAAVRVMRVQPYPDFVYLKEQIFPRFGGLGVIDIFRSNCCALHGYVIDRERVLDGELFFDTGLSVEADYDLLLRICAKYETDFALARIVIGELWERGDINDGGIDRSMEAKLGFVESGLGPIERRRRITHVAEKLQQTLGVVAPSENLSIRDLLDSVCA